MKFDKFNTYTRMKRPDIEKFREVLRSSGGNITKVAAAFGVNRGTVYNWAKEDEEFRQSVKDERGLLVDECLASARMLALGIPERDSKGNFTGWLERPDGSMLCYLLSTLGRNEGFGEERQQQGYIDTHDIEEMGRPERGVPIERWADWEKEERESGAAIDIRRKLEMETGMIP